MKWAMTIRAMVWCVVLAVVTAVIGGTARGQAAGGQSAVGPSGGQGTGGGPESVLPAGVPTSAPEGLGPYYESPRAGIAFRPPLGSKEISRLGDPDEIVTFVDEGRKWNLKVSLKRLGRPVPLTAPRESAQPGILEVYTDQLKAAPKAEVLRSDVTNVKNIVRAPKAADGAGAAAARTEPDTAMIAVRHQRGTLDLLTQMAVVKVGDSMFYLLEFTTPGSRAGGGVESASDEERTAVEVFSRIVDSVTIESREEVRKDQEERLFRTRTLYLNLTEPRVKKVLVAERWLRIIQDGKDVGYTYVIEEEAERGNRKGILVGARSRSVAGGPGEQVDQESMLFVSFDRRYEEWTNLAQLTPAKGPRRILSELGTAQREERSVFEDVPPGAAPAPGAVGEQSRERSRQLAGRRELYKVVVNYSGGGGSGEPLKREVSPWYLPQAMGHLLPRLVPATEPKGYLFASYIADRREVMLRYVDVLPEQDVTIGGKRLRAVPVNDRLGLQGTPTTHYVTKEGQYLGSVNEAAKIVVLPTDMETIQRLWNNKADLSRPKEPPGMSPAKPKG